MGLNKPLFFFTPQMQPLCRCRVILIIFFEGSIGANYTLEYANATSNNELTIDIVNGIESGQFNVTLNGTSYSVDRDSLEVEGGNCYFAFLLPHSP